MSQNDFGVIELVDEDRVYPGSQFSEVRDAVFANPYQKVWGAPGEAAAPLRDADFFRHVARALEGQALFDASRRAIGRRAQRPQVGT